MNCELPRVLAGPSKFNVILCEYPSQKSADRILCEPISESLSLTFPPPGLLLSLPRRWATQRPSRAFVGSPWTLATILRGGGTTRTYTVIKSMTYSARGPEEASGVPGGPDWGVRVLPGGSRGAVHPAVRFLGRATHA